MMEAETWREGSPITREKERIKTEKMEKNEYKS